MAEIEVRKLKAFFDVAEEGGYSNDMDVKAKDWLLDFMLHFHVDIRKQLRMSDTG